MERKRIFARKEYLQLLINDTNPLVLCLQETNFSDNNCGKIKGYLNIYKNRTDSVIASGGVAIYIKPHTFPEEITINSNLEVVVAKIKYPKALTICRI